MPVRAWVLTVLTKMANGPNQLSPRSALPVAAATAARVRYSSARGRRGARAHAGRSGRNRAGGNRRHGAGISAGSLRDAGISVAGAESRIRTAIGRLIHRTRRVHAIHRHRAPEQEAVGTVVSAAAGDVGEHAEVRIESPQTRAHVRAGIAAAIAGVIDAIGIAVIAAAIAQGLGG